MSKLQKTEAGDVTNSKRSTRPTKQRGAPWDYVVATSEDTVVHKLEEYVQSKIEAANKGKKRGMGQSHDTSKYVIVEDMYDFENEHTTNSGDYMSYDFVLDNVVELEDLDSAPVQAVWFTSEGEVRYYKMDEPWDGTKDHKPMATMSFIDLFRC